MKGILQNRKALKHPSFKLASWLLSRLLYKSLDSEESGGGGPPPDSLEIPDLVRYGDHQDPRDHHDPANLDKLGSNFLHHPAVMGSLEKLIRNGEGLFLPISSFFVGYPEFLFGADDEQVFGRKTLNCGILEHDSLSLTAFKWYIKCLVVT
ncbi:unnamed protein product [Caenorhabditis nigoni]